MGTAFTNGVSSFSAESIQERRVIVVRMLQEINRPIGTKNMFHVNRISSDTNSTHSIESIQHVAIGTTFKHLCTPVETSLISRR